MTGMAPPIRDAPMEERIEAEEDRDAVATQPRAGDWGHQSITQQRRTSAAGGGLTLQGLQELRQYRRESMKKVRQRFSLQRRSSVKITPDREDEENSDDDDHSEDDDERIAQFLEAMGIQDDEPPQEYQSSTSRKMAPSGDDKIDEAGKTQPFAYVHQRRSLLAAPRRSSLVSRRSSFQSRRSSLQSRRSSFQSQCSSLQSRATTLLTSTSSLGATSSQMLNDGRRRSSFTWTDSCTIVSGDVEDSCTMDGSVQSRCQSIMSSLRSLASEIAETAATPSTVTSHGIVTNCGETNSQNFLSTGGFDLDSVASAVTGFTGDPREDRGIGLGDDGEDACQHQKVVLEFDDEIMPHQTRKRMSNMTDGAVAGDMAALIAAHRNSILGRRGSLFSCNEFEQLCMSDNSDDEGPTAKTLSDPMAPTSRRGSMTMGRRRSLAVETGAMLSEEPACDSNIPQDMNSMVPLTKHTGRRGSITTARPRVCRRGSLLEPTQEACSDQEEGLRDSSLSGRLPDDSPVQPRKNMLLPLPHGASRGGRRGSITIGYERVRRRSSLLEPAPEIDSDEGEAGGQECNRGQNELSGDHNKFCAERSSTLVQKRRCSFPDISCQSSFDNDVFGRQEASPTRMKFPIEPSQSNLPLSGAGRLVTVGNDNTPSPQPNIANLDKEAASRGCNLEEFSTGNETDDKKGSISRRKIFPPQRCQSSSEAGAGRKQERLNATRNPNGHPSTCKPAEEATLRAAQGLCSAAQERAGGNNTPHSRASSSYRMCPTHQRRRSSVKSLVRESTMTPSSELEIGGWSHHRSDNPDGVSDDGSSIDRRISQFSFFVNRIEAYYDTSEPCTSISHEIICGSTKDKQYAQSFSSREGSRRRTGWGRSKSSSSLLRKSPPLILTNRGTKRESSLEASSSMSLVDGTPYSERGKELMKDLASLAEDVGNDATFDDDMESACSLYSSQVAVAAT